MYRRFGILIFLRQIRKTIIHIKEEVGKKFPGYEHVAMGSFLFLRYFIPAIAVPSQFGILKSTLNCVSIIKLFVSTP